MIAYDYGIVYKSKTKSLPQNYHNEQRLNRCLTLNPPLSLAVICTLHYQTNR